jgi:hypothetical protein
VYALTLEAPRVDTLTIKSLATDKVARAVRRGLVV